MGGKLKLFSIGQPEIVIAATSAAKRQKPADEAPGGGKPADDKPKPWPDFVITAIVDLPQGKPDFVFRSLAEAKAKLHPGLPAIEVLGIAAAGRRPLVVHVEHPNVIDPEDLRFIEPLTASGIDVSLGLLPRKIGR